MNITQNVVNHIQVHIYIYCTYLRENEISQQRTRCYVNTRKDNEKQSYWSELQNEIKDNPVIF